MVSNFRKSGCRGMDGSLRTPRQAKPSGQLVPEPRRLEVIIRRSEIVKGGLRPEATARSLAAAWSLLGMR